jgi:hypothetical protein
MTWWGGWASAPVEFLVMKASAGYAMLKNAPESRCECSRDKRCPDAQRMWSRVDMAYNNMVAWKDDAKTNYRPAYIDAFMGCMADYRKHREGIE